jgi:aminoglycoside 2'-N-acetyltransferase I
MERLATETDDFDIRGLSTSVPGFYERVGWERWLGPLGARKDGELVETPDEIVMISRTSGTPVLDISALLTVEWRDGDTW